MKYLVHFRTGEPLENADGSIKTFDVIPELYLRLIDIGLYTVEEA